MKVGKRGGAEVAIDRRGMPGMGMGMNEECWDRVLELWMRREMLGIGVEKSMDVGDVGGFDCRDKGCGRGGGFMGCEEWGIIFCACASGGSGILLGMEGRADSGIVLGGIVIRVSVRMGLRMRLT